LREKHKQQVFQNRVLRKTLGPNRDEITGEWRKLYNEELNDMYSSPNIIRVSKRKKVGRRTWHVEGKTEVPTGFLCRDLLYRDHFEDLAVDGRVILKWVAKK
jgi:hypothetical protein